MSIINFIYYLNRPEYFFQPKQLLKRIALNLTKKNTNEQVLLPWGTRFTASLDSKNKVNHSLFIKGIYDLSVTEVIYRLLMPAETAIDVGANIGYLTSLMADRVGNQGKVMCFEANPMVYHELCQMIKNHGWDYVIPSQIALSNQSGSGYLVVKLDNTGEGYLSTESDFNKLDDSDVTTYSVNQSRLDQLDLLPNIACIHLIKIDVEGHEREVLEGAGEWISQGKVRDIVFEEHRDYPNETTKLLESFGYTIFRIRKGFWKPILAAPEQLWRHPWEPPNYLGTLEPDRAMRLLNPHGWQSLQRA